MEEFEYIFEKIKNSNFETSPFKHIYLSKVFNEEHFKMITDAQEINLNSFASTEDLIDGIKKNGYQAITFPGTTTNEGDYINWHKTKDNRTHGNANTCEGVGITYRLKRFETEFLIRVNQFFQSPRMLEMLCEKFKLEVNNQKIEGGIQKYLDGYEISPHPDIRKKSLTWMININPMKNSEELKIHTEYMRFVDKYQYIVPFWKHNSEIDRCWVPWDWTEMVSTQTKNNTMVIFAPDCDTLHAVKLDYNHLKGQRTQIYGNLWAKNLKEPMNCWWSDLVIEPQKKSSFYKKIVQLSPKTVINMVRKIKG